MLLDVRCRTYTFDDLNLTSTLKQFMALRIQFGQIHADLIQNSRCFDARYLYIEKKRKRKPKSGFSAYNKFLLHTSDRLINRKLQEFLCNKTLQNGTYY